MAQGSGFRGLMASNLISKERGLCVRLPAPGEEVPRAVLGSDDKLLIEPLHRTERFSRLLVRLSSQAAAAYRLSLPAWAAFGKEGLETLKELVGFIRVHNPGSIILMDVCWPSGSDVSWSAEQVLEQARALGALALIVSSCAEGELKTYLDQDEDAVQIFISCHDHGCTGKEDCPRRTRTDGSHNWLFSRVGKLDENEIVGLVVPDATYPKPGQARSLVSQTVPILIPPWKGELNLNELERSLRGAVSWGGQGLLVEVSPEQCLKHSELEQINGLLKKLRLGRGGRLARC